MQAIRRVCDGVGVGSLKQKQIEAIVLHQDTFICACHAEDYFLQYCEYGYYSPLLFRLPAFPLAQYESPLRAALRWC